MFYQLVDCRIKAGTTNNDLSSLLLKLKSTPRESDIVVDQNTGVRSAKRQMIHEELNYQSKEDFALPGTACRRMVTLWKEYQWSYILPRCHGRPFLLVFVIVVVFIDKPPSCLSSGPPPTPTHTCAPTAVFPRGGQGAQPSRQHSLFLHQVL